MTKEEIETTFANQPYWAYKQGLQDGMAYTWASFRRDAAKDIFASLVNRDGPTPTHTITAIVLADELVKQLKEKEK